MELNNNIIYFEEEIYLNIKGELWKFNKKV